MAAHRRNGGGVILRGLYIYILYISKQFNKRKWSCIEKIDIDSNSSETMI